MNFSCHLFEKLLNKNIEMDMFFDRMVKKSGQPIIFLCFSHHLGSSLSLIDVVRISSTASFSDSRSKRKALSLV